MSQSARLFVAVWPPEPVMATLADLPRPDVPGLRWTSPEQWHVTLRFLGQVADVEEVLSSFAGLAVPRGEARLGPSTGRFGQSILHVPVAGLGELAAAVSSLPSPEADRPFRGHVTLARSRGRGGGGVDLRPLVGVPVAASWPVEEVTLVASHLGRGPARYRVLASNTCL
ncbi:MAG TPA: RNA 2',3'-cyclic phosphodiesterase [Acidimicrobiales bacterium]|nr:RNA 2',3'-cyclic phosphodiesterase [Acidimicrobiales bacterium]